MFKRLIRLYNFKAVESKWQEVWATQHKSRSGNKFYCLSMFPYPSGNLHIGHVRVYSISDTLSRFEHLCGKEVLHPMGWDAFGLPAENAAIERKIAPAKWTLENIAQMKSQMLKLGLLFNWDREISTCSPEYYRWTQELFCILFKQGLAYQKEGYINWDPVDKTVLANEQVDEQGKSWRSGALVEKKLMKQWYFKITNYAEELLEDLKELKWPENVVEMQRGWIGKTTGHEVRFGTNQEDLVAFTTRLETLMGVTFLALAPEHEFIAMHASAEEKLQVLSMTNKTETNRKIGKSSIVLQNVKAIHPITKTELPIIVSEYVLMHAGTGCVMGVPAHDDRDNLVAKERNFTSIQVLDKDHLINSGEFTGLTSSDAINIISKKLSCKVISNYRMKDWLVSRQRYWGVPIPIIHCNKCGPVLEPNLPLVLPPIEEKLSWLHTTCPSCGGPGLRESDTLDTFVDSSWYYLRYIDSKNSSEICNSDLAKKWTPVNVYVGGIEHAILHLLYSRFIHKVLRDQGIVSCNEPFYRLLTQGLVLGPTYKINGRYLSPDEAKDQEGVEIKFEKMSKSKKNGVSPEVIREEWGADTLRLSVLFAAPSEKEIEWNGNLLKTMKKWMNFIEELQVEDMPKENMIKLVKDITRCMENRKFHVAVARLMEYGHALKKKPSKENYKEFLVMLYPFAPHTASEMYEKWFSGDIRDAEWPEVPQYVRYK